MSSNEVPIHELNSKLRTIDTNAKKLKTEYDAVAKRRGREMLTEYSNAYLRMENTNNYSGVASTSSSSPFSLLVFPTEEENKAYSRAAALKRETAVLAWRAKLERDLRPKIERVREKFADLLEENYTRPSQICSQKTPASPKTSCRFKRIFSSDTSPNSTASSPRSNSFSKRRILPPWRKTVDDELILLITRTTVKTTAETSCWLP